MSLDDLVWATDESYVMIDSVIRVLTQSEQFASELDRLFDGFDHSIRVADPSQTFRIATEAHSSTVLYRNRSPLGSFHSHDRLFGYLVTALNREAVEQSPWFAVHAGVVRRGDAMVALPAVSGGGKTTLTSGCLLQGFDYLSDEALVINDLGSVVPHPRPLALSPSSCDILGLEPTPRERLLTPGELGAQIGSGGTLTDIVLATFGAGDVSLQGIARSTAIEALLTRSFNHYKNPERAFELAAATARSVNVWRLEYGDPLEAAALLRDRLG